MIQSYAEFHCHSNYSFQEWAAFIQELLPRAVDLGYPALNQVMRRSQVRGHFFAAPRYNE